MRVRLVLEVVAVELDAMEEGGLSRDGWMSGSGEGVEEVVLLDGDERTCKAAKLSHPG